jgi:hypothetical protein
MDSQFISGNALFLNQLNGQLADSPHLFPLTRSQNPLLLPKDYHSYMVFMKEKWNGNGLVDYETAALNLNMKYLKKFVTLVPCLSNTLKSRARVISIFIYVSFSFWFFLVRYS